MLQSQSTQDIIDKFETYLDDGTELAPTEELDLANKKYQEVCSDRPWEFLKKPATGNITIANGLATIALPADFREFAINDQLTDNSGTIDNNSGPKVIFVGHAYTEYRIINFSDRRRYLNNTGFAYLDLANNRIVFTSPPPDPTDLAYEFDYIMVPPDLNLTTSNPVFPARFWDIIYHLMAVDDQIIQIQDRAHSYMNENQNAAAKYLADMAYWNSNLLND